LKIINNSKIIMLVMPLIMYGCTGGNLNTQVTTQVSPSLTSELISTPLAPLGTASVNPTLTNTVAPTETLTPTIIPSATNISKLPREDQENIIYDLFMDNGGCQLPCWWGITPGRTTWDDARIILEPLNLPEQAYLYHRINDFASFIVPVKEGMHPHLYQTSFTLLVENSIVQSLYFFDDNLAVVLDYESFIIQMGVPDDMRVFTHSGENGEHVPATVAFFYPDAGVLVEYQFPAVVDSEITRICMNFGDGGRPFVWLWDGDLGWSYEDVDKIWDLPLENAPLEEVTSTDVTTIYQKIISDKGDACLETPIDFWYPSGIR